MKVVATSLVSRLSGWRRGSGYALLAVVLGLCSLASQAEQTLRVGVPENPPKITLGANGQPSGLLGDVLVAMAAAEGWRLQAVACAWQACLDQLRAGQIDVLPDVAYTPERAQYLGFHRTPALLSWSQLYTHPRVTLRSILDLRGKRIAVVRGSVQEPALRQLLDGFAINAMLVPVASFDQGFEDVAAGRIDMVAANRFYGDSAAAARGLDATALVFQPAQLFYAVGAGRHDDILRAIDQHLQAWQGASQSPYAQALDQWLHARQAAQLPTWWPWALSGVVALLTLAAGVIVGLRVLVRKQTARLREREAWLSTILDNVEAHIYIKDRNLRYRYANAPTLRWMGHSADTVVGHGDAELYDAATAAILRHNDEQVVTHGLRVQSEEAVRRHGGGDARHFLSVKLPLRDSAGQVYALCGISTDITQRKEDEAAIHQLAFFDPLTGLPNRRLLMDRVETQVKALARSHQRAALLFIDLDNFKDVNDTLGHDAGDLLLREVAQRIQDSIRAQDTLARQGGDEFVVMLVDLNPDAAEAARAAQAIAYKVLAAVHAPVQVGAVAHHVSVSIGVALMDRQTATREDALKQADLAMYQAKAEGRNRVCFFDPAMQSAVLARTSLEADLRWALQAQEFVLYYQPQVHADGVLLGYEALVRWQHPMRGLVGPAAFIPLAESCGVILPLGDWILNQACYQLARWKTTPEAARRCIAVNVSAQQFRQTQFVQLVQDALQRSGAPAANLELELTESQLVDDVEGVVSKMLALKALGVRLSLDDFGTGYSSLAMLKRLPLDQLKIDMSFVRDMQADARSAALVQAIVRMGESLGLDVIAEGVEQVAQRDALMAMGCVRYQGYLYGKPEPLS